MNLIDSCAICAGGIFPSPNAHMATTSEPDLFMHVVSAAPRWLLMNCFGRWNGSSRLRTTTNNQVILDSSNNRNLPRDE